MFRQNTFSRKERSLAALRFFEERLEERGTGYLVGDSPTYVDLGLFYILFELAEEDNVPDFAERFQVKNACVTTRFMFVRRKRRSTLGRLTRALVSSFPSLEHSYIECRRARNLKTTSRALEECRATLATAAGRACTPTSRAGIVLIHCKAHVEGTSLHFGSPPAPKSSKAASRPICPSKQSSHCTPDR